MTGWTSVSRANGPSGRAIRSTPLTDNRIDGRDLWSGRVTIGFKPFQNVQTYLVWEHFSEDDDRMRTAKQLCNTDPIPTEIGGVPVKLTAGEVFDMPGDYLKPRLPDGFALFG